MSGDMSIVGPRPHAIGMRIDGKASIDLDPQYTRRYRVKPGLTGWAQINGARGAMHSRDDLLRRIRHDLYYIENLSPILDVKIIALTVTRAFRDPNAY